MEIGNNYKIETDDLNAKVMRKTDRLTQPKDGVGGGEPVWEVIGYCTTMESALSFLYGHMIKQKSKKIIKTSEHVKEMLEEFRTCRDEILYALDKMV